MIIIMKDRASTEQITQMETRLKNLGFQTHPIVGEFKTIIGAIGDKRLVDMEALKTLPGVEDVVPIMKPYKLAGRELIKEKTQVNVSGVTIGGKRQVVFAGPCAIESEEQVVGIAKAVKASGASILRGGAFKPRTSPYSFKGLAKEGLEILKTAREETGLPIITEVMDTRDVELVSSYVDMLQIGARNMQNFSLLTEVGRTNKPVLLKRGLSARVEEWLMAAEYIMSEGNENVVLCERGITTFETATRNTVDIAAVAVVNELSHLPIIVDPSHATGHSKYVPCVARAAIAAGADGLMIEVHNDPQNAMCDGPQSITPGQFDELMGRLAAISGAVDRSL